MATTVNVDSTFSGKWAGDYIRSAFQANDTLQGITVKENIEFKAIVKRLADEIDFGAANCSFNPTGTVAITERVLELKKFQVQRQICVNSFLQDWNAKDAQNGEPIDPAEQYRYDPDLGPVRARESDVGDLVVRGQTLLDLGQNVFSDTRSMTESRDLMRALIATKLHGQPLHTRHVLMELQDL